MNDLQAILAETVGRIFTDLVSDTVISAAEQGTWPAKLWDALEENGITQPLVPESRGGAGGAWRDAWVAVRAAGKHAAPVPLPETIMASWLLAEAGLDVPPGPLTVAPVRTEDRLRLERRGGAITVSGVATRVPWGAAARHLVVTGAVDDRPWVALVPGTALVIAHDHNMALEPRDTVTFDGTPAVAAAPAGARVPADAVRLMGAMMRAGQMAGALERALEEAVKHVTVRVQFGRPLAKFQAVQHQLAVLGELTAAARVAAEHAFRAADRGEPRFEIACAKVRAGEAAGAGASIAHGVHGAIGFTYEHVLHFATRRLWSWRSEFGTETTWAEELGRAACRAGADQLWPTLTASR
jgi:acyl-CoA dehydrogenase